jgi:VWFA-related protein
MRLMRRVLIVAGVAAMAVAARGQQQQQPGQAGGPTYSADVKVVNVLATVRDKNGKFITDLGQNDFVLEEDGRRQTIKYFSRESDLPLTLGLLVDTSRSQRLTIEQERSASAAFVDRVLRENKDGAFLIHFDREVELLQDVTKSPRPVANALEKMQLASDETAGTQSRRPRPQSSDGDPSSSDDSSSRSSGQSPDDQGQQGGQGQPGSGRYPGGPRRQGGGGQMAQRGRTLLYDSVFLASEEITRKQSGRKVVIVLSDGVDRGSKTTIEQAIRAAQRADTVVYAVYFAGEKESGQGGNGGWGGPGRRGGGIGFPGRFPTGGGGYPGGSGGGGRGGRSEEPKVDGKKILERVAKETGGRMFEANKKQTAEKIYQQIEDDLRHQYSLGYTPDRASEEGAYRAIKLTTRKNNLIVQTRDGYYASGTPAHGAAADLK